MATSLDFHSLSKELQLLIVESCDMPTLYHLCLTNREMYSMAEPVLWQTIDFVNARNHHIELIEWQRRFFATCEVLLEDYRERWELLARRVEILQLGRLPGPQIPRKSTRELSHYNEGPFYCGDGQMTIFNIIAHFPKLRTLTLFLKNDWDGPWRHDDQPLKENLTNLTTLRVGGQIDPGWLYALLSRPETISSLSLINLLQQAGQDHGPDPLLFLRPLINRFTSLKTLHLSKIADLDLREEYDATPEREALEEWIGLLKGVSSTLVDLTLEMCCTDFGRGKHRDSPDQGDHSELQCKDMLLPVLLDSEWPKLERLTLVGLDILSPLDSMHSGIKVVYLPRRRKLDYYYDATPLDVSPPNGLFV